MFSSFCDSKLRHFRLNLLLKLVTFKGLNVEYDSQFFTVVSRCYSILWLIFSKNKHPESYSFSSYIEAVFFFSFHFLISAKYYIINHLKLSVWAEEMAQRLRVLAALQRTQVQFCVDGKPETLVKGRRV